MQRLKCEFVMEYQDEELVIYVSALNNVPVDLPVFHAIMVAWSPLWQEASAKFNFNLNDDPDLAHLAGKMFFV